MLNRYRSLWLAAVALALSAGVAQAQGDGPVGPEAPPNQLVWSYERWAGGELVDSGELTVDRGGFMYCIQPSAAGGLLRVMAFGPEFSGKAEQPSFLDDKPRYSAGIWQQGRLVALQHTAGEHWIVRLGERRFELNEPHTLEYYVLSGTMQPPGERARNWNVKARGGGWFVSGNPSSPNFLYGPPGALIDELPPDLRGLQWIEVELPAGRGRFLGSAVTPGLRWTVDLGGREYSATAGPGSRSLTQATTGD